LQPPRDGAAASRAPFATWRAIVFEDYLALLLDMQLLAYQSDLTRVISFRVSADVYAAITSPARFLSLDVVTIIRSSTVEMEVTYGEPGASPIPCCGENLVFVVFGGTHYCDAIGVRNADVNGTAARGQFSELIVYKYGQV
jgi:hypothetical protein